MSTVGKMTVEEHVRSFEDKFKEVPNKIRVFTLSLRSLYAEKAVSSSTDAGKSIITLRNDMRKDATIYANVIFPFSIEIVTYVEAFADFYEVLEYDEWKQNLPDILEEVTGYRQCCTEIESMHEDIMAPLKKGQDQARRLISELQGLNQELEKRVKELQAKSASEGMWACVLLVIPCVGVIAAPILGVIAENDLAMSLAGMAQFHINESALYVIKCALIPALTNFIEGLHAAAGFFEKMQEELTIFIREGEKASEGAQRLHFKMMRGKAVEIKGSCKEFYAVVPGVRTDLECIPQNPDDQNYVDKWLIDQKERIKEKYHGKISASLKKFFNIK